MAWWIFQNVVITTVLAAAVVVVTRATRMGPVGRHALWLLVLLKFVTPPLVVWPWAAPDPFGIAALDARASDARMSTASRAESGVTLAIDETVVVPSAVPAAPVSRSDRDVSSASTAEWFWPWFLGVWAFGSVCALGIEGVRLVRLARRVSLGTPADPAIVSRVHALSVRLGLRPVPVITVDVGTPVVWGLGRPRLLWPASLPVDATEACIDGVLVHELAHVKRGDHLVGWIELAAGVVWWWNPLFWFVRSALREQSELACDAWVISALPNGRRAYAESLLALSGADVPTTASMAVVGVRATNRRVLERRLVMIMKGRSSLRLPWIGLCSLAIVAAATLPAWATAPQQLPPQAALPPQLPAPVIVQVPPQPPPAVWVARPPARARAQATTKTPPPPPPPVVHYGVVPMKSPLAAHQLGFFPQKAKLPEDGQKLLEGFQNERDAIQAEADKKVEDRWAAAVKSLENLQAQYAKEGKLDEAVAIRDYLRNAASGTKFYRYTIKK